MATASADEVREALFDDTVFWAERFARIVNKSGELVPLAPKPGQLKLDRALERQRADGLPMRAIVLKARQTGISTWTECKIMHRITQRKYRRALVVAHNKDAAAHLFGISDRIYVNLPSVRELALKPPCTNRRRGSYMYFGTDSRLQRNEGIVGLDSSLEVDTANEVQAGRGFTFTELHGSEVAMWPHVEKLTALLAAVPDEPETMVVLESTAMGNNHFKRRWDQAVSGESGYVPVFIAWHDEEGYRVPFRTDEDREEFAATIGEGPWGEAEPRLVEEFGCTPEQLQWRRRSILDDHGGDLELFRQEYPASPEEAFMVSGKHVFSMTLVSRVLDRVKQTDPEIAYPDNPGPDLGEFKAENMVPRKVRSGMIEVPTGAKWVPKAEAGHGSLYPFWRVWEHPDKGQVADEREGIVGRPMGRYVIAVDPSAGEENETGDTAFHGVQVIDHRTRAQVAEYRSRIDPDLLAIQVYLAAQHWNKAIIAIEKTGGYGLSMLRRIWRDYGYPLVYRQKTLDKAKDTQFEDRMGWDTNRSTKALLEDGLRELLREMPEAFRSRILALELTTYIKDERGKTGPEPDAFADLLMSFAIAQQVAQEWVVPRDRQPGAITSTRSVRDPVTGW